MRTQSTQEILNRINLMINGVPTIKMQGTNILITYQNNIYHFEKMSDAVNFMKEKNITKIKEL